MADSDVPGLTELSAVPAAGDLFHVVDVSDTSAAPDGTDKKITATNLLGGTAPIGADYLTGTAQSGLSSEIVVGTSPGGELGGTWASPTVDASHSGSTHAAVQAAAEATAASALTAHLDDTSDAHDASAISADSTTLVGTGTDVQAVLEELDNGIADHLADTTAAHAATAISVDSTNLTGTSITVQGSLEELEDAIDAHIADSSAAHAASAVSYAGGTGMSATDVEAAIDELATEKISADGGYVQFNLSFSTIATSTLTDQASAEQLFAQNNASIQIADLTFMRQVRLVIYVMTGSASANTPRLRVRYKTGAWSATLASYADIGTSEVACSLTTGTTAVASSWIDLAAGALADVWVAVTQLGGDAAADPAVRFVTVHFRD